MGGSAVLVHGAWSNPHDWSWVERRLVESGVKVTAVDLPTHRSSTASHADDVSEVERAAASTAGPVVLVGWSYGCSVVNDAEVHDAVLAGHVFVAAPPPVLSAGSSEDEAPSAPPFDLSILRFPDDKSCVLDEDYWLNGPAATFTSDLIDHLRSHPRRPIAVEALFAAPTREAWRQVRTAIVLGRDDLLCPEPRQRWAREHIDDVRVIDSDHFIPFRNADVVAAVALEILTT